MLYKTRKTQEFVDWFKSQTQKSQFQIEKRLEKIQSQGHLGVIRADLGDGLCELKWKCGRRIYFVFTSQVTILLLLGGNKNGQSKDITRAKKILRQYTDT